MVRCLFLFPTFRTSRYFFQFHGSAPNFSHQPVWLLKVLSVDIHLPRSMLYFLRFKLTSLRRLRFILCFFQSWLKSSKFFISAHGLHNTVVLKRALFLLSQPGFVRRLRSLWPSLRPPTVFNAAWQENCCIFSQRYILLNMTALYAKACFFLLSVSLTLSY